jgi:enoyl-CoA hydratase
MKDLIIEPQGAWVRLVLNRPEHRNALNTAMLAHLAEALGALAADTGIRAVMICGAQGCFAAGADIGEIADKSSADGRADPRKAHWAAIRAFPKPLVAAVEGFALGGGLELALMADLIVLSEGAKIGLPEATLGLIPGAGGGQRLMARVGRARAARMVLLGEIIDAETAYAWGIASHLAPDAQAAGAALTEKLARGAPLALQAAKAALIAGEERVLALPEERAAFEALLDSRDKTEGIAAFRSKRRAAFEGR